MADLTISISLDATGITSGVAQAKSGMESLARTSFDKLADSLKSVSDTIRNVGGALSNLGQTLASAITSPLAALTGRASQAGQALNTFVKSGIEIAKKQAADAEKAFISLAERGMQQTAKHAADGTQALFALAGQGIREAQRQASGATQAFQELAGRGFAEAQKQAQGVVQAFGSLASGGIAPVKKQLQEAGSAFVSLANEGIQLAANRAAQAGQTLSAFAKSGIEIVKNHAGQAKQSLEALAQGGIEMARGRVEQAKQAFLGLAKSGLEEVKNQAGQAKQALEAFAQNGVEQVKGRVQEAKNALMELAGGAAARAKSAFESLAKIDLTALSGKIGDVGSKLQSVGTFLKGKITNPLLAFWGKDDASKEIEGKIAKLKERFNALLSKLFEPVLPYLSKGADALIGIVDRVIQWFENAPESVRVFIAVIVSIGAAIGPVIAVVGTVVTAIASLVSGIAAIAAAGTVSVVVGAIAAAIAMLVAGIGIAIGVVYGLQQAWAAGFGPIASLVAIVVGLIITAFAPILGLPILIGAIAVTIYEMWAANFGGLRDFTTQVWAKIQEYIAIAMAEIEALVATIGADIVAWWNENYPLIEQTVQTVSDAIKTRVEAFLKAITDFWDAHGEQIMSVVRSIWTIISTIVRTGVQVIMGVVRMVMQIINGDWAGAWNTAKDIVWKIVTAIGTVLKEMNNIVLQALKFVVTTIVGWGTDLFKKAVEIGKNIVQGIIDGIGAIAGKLMDYAKSVILRMFGVMDNAAETHSPSMVTTRMGVFVGMGLVNGLRSMTGPVAVAAKDMVDAGLGNMGKEAQAAVDEFNKFRDDLENDPQKQRDLVTVANYNDAKSKLEQLIKLRAELGRDVGAALPKTLDDINKKLKELEGLQDARGMLKKMTDELEGANLPKSNRQQVNALLKDKERGPGIDNSTRGDLIAKANQLDEKLRADEMTRAKEKLIQAGTNANLQLREEIGLLQAKIDNNFRLSEAQAQQVKNKIELEKLEISLKENGFSEKEIEILKNTLMVEQEHTAKLRATLQAKQDLVAANETYTNATKQMEATLEQLNVQLGLKKAASEADRLATDMQTEAYKKLNAEQAANLKKMAEEIDSKKAEVKAREDAKKQMDEFKGFIKDSLNTIARDGFGAFFKGIFEKFKQMLIDMAAEWIASKLYKLFFKGGAAGEEGGGIGGLFGKVLQAIGLGPKKKDSVATQGGGTNPNPDPATITGTVTDAPRGMFGPMENIVTGETSKLAGKMSGIGSLMTLAGGLIGGRVGGILSMAGTGMSIGAMFGPWGAAIGAVAGGLIGLFMGDPKKKIDKKENMPKLQKGFTEALQQLRDLLNDRNQIFSDPDGAIQRAMDIRGQIASGFGIEFQSKKYKKIAQQQIGQKLVEADAIIKQIKEMADVARMAGKVDTRLEAEFATGVYADREFIRQHADFKRRNGLLSGAFTGRDTLPSMLAPGEMVLNPKQIARVKFNAGFDAFKGAGIPNYAAGGFIPGPVNSPAPSVSPQPVTVQIVLNNSGIVESDIKGVLVNGLKESDVQVELVKAYDKGKTRTR